MEGSSIVIMCPDLSMQFCDKEDATAKDVLEDFPGFDLESRAGKRRIRLPQDHVLHPGGTYYLVAKKAEIKSANEIKRPPSPGASLKNKDAILEELSADFDASFGLSKRPAQGGSAIGSIQRKFSRIWGGGSSKRSSSTKSSSGRLSESAIHSAASSKPGSPEGRRNPDCRASAEVQRSGGSGRTSPGLQKSTSEGLLMGTSDEGAWRSVSLGDSSQLVAGANFRGVGTGVQGEGDASWGHPPLHMARLPSPREGGPGFHGNEQYGSQPSQAFAHAGGTGVDNGSIEHLQQQHHLLLQQQQAQEHAHAAFQNEHERVMMNMMLLQQQQHHNLHRRVGDYGTDDSFGQQFMGPPPGGYSGQHPSYGSDLGLSVSLCDSALLPQEQQQQQQQQQLHVPFSPSGPKPSWDQQQQYNPQGGMQLPQGQVLYNPDPQTQQQQQHQYMPPLVSFSQQQQG